MRRMCGGLWRISKHLMVAMVLLLMVSAAGMLFLKYQHKTVYAVQSGSMEPVFGKGDAVVLSEKFQSLHTGDIVSFYSQSRGGVLVTHRIIAIDAGRDRILTKGDSAPGVDEPIRRADVVGKIEFRLPLLGYGLDFLRQPAGLALAVYLPAATIMTSEIQKLARYYASRRYRLHGYLIQ